MQILKIVFLVCDTFSKCMLILWDQRIILDMSFTVVFVWEDEIILKIDVLSASLSK